MKISSLELQSAAKKLMLNEKFVRISGFTQLEATRRASTLDLLKEFGGHFESNEDDNESLFDRVYRTEFYLPLEYSELILKWDDLYNN